MNRKRESELEKTRKEHQAQVEEYEKSISDLRKKHTDNIGELEEQLQNLQKAKAKYVVYFLTPLSGCFLDLRRRKGLLPMNMMTLRKT